MKYILVFIPFLLMSCGKNGGSSQATNLPVKEDNAFIDTDLVKEPELMNITMSVPVAMNDYAITFQKSASAQDNSCIISVGQGDIWRLQRTPGNLEIDLPNGHRKILKPVGSPSNVQGSWTWSGKENGLKLITRYTLLSNQVIINQNCER